MGSRGMRTASGEGSTMQLHSLYHLPIIVRMTKSRRLKWAEHVARTDEGRSACKILTCKPTGKRPLGRSRYRWEDVKMNLKEIDANMELG